MRNVNYTRRVLYRTRTSVDLHHLWTDPSRLLLLPETQCSDIASWPELHYLFSEMDKNIKNCENKHHSNPFSKIHQQHQGWYQENILSIWKPIIKPRWCLENRVPIVQQNPPWMWLFWGPIKKTPRLRHCQKKTLVFLQSIKKQVLQNSCESGRMGTSGVSALYTLHTDNRSSCAWLSCNKTGGRLRHSQWVLGAARLLDEGCELDV